MLTQQELSWLYQFVDAPKDNTKGVENKIMVANIMTKLPLMLQALQAEATEQLVEQALQAKVDAKKAKAKARAAKRAVKVEEEITPKEE